MGERKLMIASHETLPRSSSMHYVYGSFFYDRLPSETLNLSILKLDHSSFCVEVAKAATVVDLKQAVEALFCHVPHNGPGKFSLHFVHHVSDTCSVQRKLSKKQVGNLKQHRRSPSKVYRYQQKEDKDDNGIGLDDIVIENGKIQHCNAEENGVGKSRLAGFFGGLFSHSQLEVGTRARIEGKICCSMMAIDV